MDVRLSDSLPRRALANNFGEPLSQAIMNDLVEQDNIEATMDSVRTANELLLYEVESYKRAHEDMSKNIDHLKSNLLQRNQELVDKDKLISRLRDSVINQEKFDHHKILIEKKLNDRHQDAVRKWQAKVDAQAAEIESLRADEISLKKELLSKNSQLERLVNEIMPFKDKEIDELKQRLHEDASHARQSAQNKAVQGSEARCRKLHHENALLQEQVLHTEAALKETRSVAADSDGTAALSEMQSEYAKLETAAGGLKKQIEFLTHLNASLKEQLSGLCESSAAMEAHILLQEQTNTRLLNELDDNRNAVDQEIAICKADCSARVIQLQRQRDASHCEAETLRDEINAEREKNARMNEKFIGTETELKQQTEQLKANMFTLTRQSDEQRVRADEALNTMLRQKTAAVTELQQQLDVAHKNNEFLQNDLQARMLEIGQLRAHVTRMRALEAQIAEGLQDRSRLREQLGENATETDTLKQRVQERDGAIEHSRQKIVQLTDLLKTEKVDRIRELKSVQQTHAEQLDALRRTLKELQSQHEQLQSKYAELQSLSQNDAERAKQKAAKLQETARILRSEVEKKDAKLQTFAVNGVKLDEYVALRDEVDLWRRKHGMFKKLLSTAFAAAPPTLDASSDNKCRTIAPITRDVYANSALNASQFSSDLFPASGAPAAVNSFPSLSTKKINPASASVAMYSQLNDVKVRADLMEERFKDALQTLTS